MRRVELMSPWQSCVRSSLYPISPVSHARNDIVMITWRWLSPHINFPGWEVSHVPKDLFNVHCPLVSIITQWDTSQTETRWWWWWPDPNKRRGGKSATQSGKVLLDYPSLMRIREHSGLRGGGSESILSCRWEIRRLLIPLYWYCENIVGLTIQY